MKKKKYSNQQKAQIVMEILKGDKTVSQISSEYGIHTSQLYKWREKVQAGMSDLFEDSNKSEQALKAHYEHQADELYAEIGKLTTQLSWLKKKSGIEIIER